MAAGLGARLGTPAALVVTPLAVTWPLEPDRDAMTRMGETALGYLSAFVEARATAPAGGLDGGVEVGRTLARTMPPEQPSRSFDALLHEIADAADRAFDTTGPGYFAFIPGGGLFAAGVADLLACVTNRFVNLAAPSPALVGIETSVVRWLCDVFGLPDGAMGILTSGGSMANLSAVVTARTALLGESFLDGTIYVTEHAHQSVAKAARIAGFPEANVHVVPTLDDLTVDVAALVQAIDADVAAGLRPCCVVANAGTTNTGAVDPIGTLADLCAARNLWLHVDAAYGGFFQLTERGRRAFAGIERADSITLDPHKGMFLPYGTGCLLVRDGAALKRAHVVGGAYLQDLAADEELPSFSEYSPELSRDFRGLRVWLPLHLHGVGAFRSALDEKLDLTAVVHEAFAADPNLEVPWTPHLSIVAFRLRGGDDAANRALLDAINASGRVFLSSTVVDGRFTLRVCVLAHRTHRDRVDELVDIVRSAAAKIADHG